MKVRKSTGVMSKDGVTPYAAGTLHYTQATERGLMYCPADYTVNNLAHCIAALYEGKIESVELIDTDNRKYVYELTAAEKRALSK